MQLSTHCSENSHCYTGLQMHTPYGSSRSPLQQLPHPSQASLPEALVLCQEKVQIKYNQFPLFVIVNSLSLLRPFPSFSDIVPHIHLETNIHNDYEYGLYYRMFQYIQKLVYMHECS